MSIRSLRGGAVAGRLVIALAVSSVAASHALADWAIWHGAEKLLQFPATTGKVARVPAEAISHGFSATLQLECFNHPELSGWTLGVILSRETRPGAMGYRYRLDNQPAVVVSPGTRTSLKSHALSPFPGGLKSGKTFRLELTPASGPTLSFDFDVRGAGKAMDAVGCNAPRVKEDRPSARPPMPLSSPLR